MKEENDELQTHLLEIESLKVDDLNSHHSCLMTNALCGLFFWTDNTGSKQTSFLPWEAVGMLIGAVNLVQAKWLPTLKLLVSKINDTFSNNFKEMAVAGEVLLGMWHW